jgi:hypothetical protein
LFRLAAMSGCPAGRVRAGSPALRGRAARPRRACSGRAGAREVVQADGDVPGVRRGRAARRIASASRRAARPRRACSSPAGAARLFRPMAMSGCPAGRVARLDRQRFAKSGSASASLFWALQEIARLFRPWAMSGCPAGRPRGGSPALRGRAARPRRACSGSAGAFARLFRPVAMSGCPAGRAARPDRQRFADGAARPRRACSGPAGDREVVQAAAMSGARRGGCRAADRQRPAQVRLGLVVAAQILQRHADGVAHACLHQRLVLERTPALIEHLHRRLQRLQHRDGVLDRLPVTGSLGNWFGSTAASISVWNFATASAISACFFASASCCLRFVACRTASASCSLAFVSCARPRPAPPRRACAARPRPPRPLGRGMSPTPCRSGPVTSAAATALPAAPGPCCAGSTS